MGIPKFFRWVSERYPLTSQLITPNSIPTFDNLYLDMNGIIHNCSHPPSSENDIHFRISEEQMILGIFSYIDHLFTKIKPRKVFFMAIDGVAPRAKMNQQRSRRFRTAKDAREMREAAERKGEKLPEEKAFDSNCITPGTPFMARLSEHLKYYIRKKITEDAEWRNVTVILSGHDVPGEGEHKIQEFIRLTKAQPDYNPNTRHCLYGLDADLIMLGLLSHDPHFCLLREEVTFGRKTKKSTGLNNTNFYLLHLSLLREYLDLEFSSLAPQLPFGYDLERIIDDFILMAIFVGNDFLPHLPDLHINEGALEVIWNIYKEILPTAGGYLNEYGTISLPRLQLMLDQLAKFERENFEQEFADANWYKGKQEKELAAMEKARKRGKLIITKDQQKYLTQIREFVEKHRAGISAKDRLTFVNSLPTRDRRFVQELADSLHLNCTWDEIDDYGQPLVVLSFNMEGVSEDGEEGKGREKGVNGDDSTGVEKENGAEEEDEEWESDEDPEGDLAIKRVFDKYSKAKVVDNFVEDFEENYEESVKKKMDEWKRIYYKSKLEINYDDPESLQPLIFRYIEGLQWILNYYYKGVSSWGWFYNYHYAPKISDLRGIADFKFNFDLGKPFLPFQQLMGVLPMDSMEHVPAAYRELMYDEKSPILDFYPRDFELDMNGKKQDWEAVVKIPFIDEARLLRAMGARDQQLTPEERSRNSSGVLSTKFVYDDGDETKYQSSLPGFFPDLTMCKCAASPFNLPTLGNGVELVTGLLEGVHLGASALAGFPSLQTLPHQGALGFHGVNVFQSDSRNQSMIITLTGKHDKASGPNGAGNNSTAQLAKSLIGHRTFHNWPYLQEGMVVAVSDDTFKYEMHAGPKGGLKVVSTPHNPFQAIAWKKEADRIEHYYSKRCGVIIGNVDVVLHVRPLKGLKRLDTGALVKDYEGPDKEISQAYQAAVHQVTFEDERYLEKPAPPISEEFPNGEKVIFLGTMKYGTASQVVSSSEMTLDIALSFFPNEETQNMFFSRIVANRPAGHYYPSPQLARRLGISSLGLSRITSSLLVQLKDDSKKNIGLALKFESKGLKVLGYSRKADRGWEFSEKTAQLLERYKAAFPEPFQNLDSRTGDIVTSAEICPTSSDPDSVIREMSKWLKAEGISDLEPVSLFAEQLEKETVNVIEQAADSFRKSMSRERLKRAVIEGIPRQAVLKPSHAIYRLQGQKFGCGDRVVMVQDASAGGVPLAMKGVVIGLNARDIDVVWDVPFIGGETLGGRCSEYRGSTVPFTSVLNLTNPQFRVDSNTQPRVLGQSDPFRPQLGPKPVIAPKNYRPSIPANRPVPTQIMQNPAHRHPHPHQHQAHGHQRRGSFGISSTLHYGNAVKGVKSHQQAQDFNQPAAAVNQRDKLQSALLKGQPSNTTTATHILPRSQPTLIPIPLPGQPIQIPIGSPATATSAPAPAPAPASKPASASVHIPMSEPGIVPVSVSNNPGGAMTNGVKGDSTDSTGPANRHGQVQGRGRGRGGHAARGHGKGHVHGNGIDGTNGRLPNPGAGRGRRGGRGGQGTSARDGRSDAQRGGNVGGSSQAKHSVTANAP